MDTQIVGEIAAAAASTGTGFFIWLGKRSTGKQEADKAAASALAEANQQLLVDERIRSDRLAREADELRQRLTREEAENDRLHDENRRHSDDLRRTRSERDHLREELDFAHARIAELGGP